MTLEASDPTARFMLSRDMPAEHHEAWEDLLERQPRYTTDRQIAPLKRPEYREHVRRFIVVQFVYNANSRGRDNRPIGLWCFDGSSTDVLPLRAETSDAAAIMDRLLCHALRGFLVVWVNGIRSDYRTLLRCYLPAICDLGYSVEVASDSQSPRWLRVKKDKHAWWWCDFSVVTGYTATTWPTLWPKTRGEPPGPKLTPTTGYWCVANLQRILQQHFEVSLRPTLAGASIGALARHMPEDLWVWHPPSLLVSMLRVGAGYRGGYCYAERYRGPAVKWDINRLHTWALGQPLPARAAIARGRGRAKSPPGIYMCSVSGRGSMPVYLPVWYGAGRIWRKRYFHSGAATTILATAEIAGIRRLGYRVDVGYGYEFTETFNLKPYVAIMERMLRKYGRKSAEAQVARNMANMACGKLGSDPEHTECCWSIERPGEDWSPMIDGITDEWPNLWQRTLVSYSAAQHVDIAATITAHGRNRLYKGFDAVIAAGGKVVYSDTDSIIATPCIPAQLGVSSTKLGAFRYLGHDDDGIVLGRKKYSHGGEARLSGYRSATPRRTRELFDLGDSTG